MEKHLPNNNEGHEKKTLELIINGQKHEWPHQYITGAEVRELGKIAKEDKIFLDIEKPWDDEVIANDTKTDLARPGIEQFFSVKHENDRLVIIHVNDREKKITRGKHTVQEIKNTDNVPDNYVLSEAIDGELKPLDNNGTVLIKGGECFLATCRTVNLHKCENMEDQIKELKTIAPNLSQAQEGGLTYIKIEGLKLPEHCNPNVVNALLCPMQMGGYPSTLFFSSVITNLPSRNPPHNWNRTNVRILDSTWHALSWMAPQGLTLREILQNHLDALR